MRRREFIAALGGAAVLPRAAFAQSLPRIGVLMSHPEEDADDTTSVVALRGALEQLGRVDGRNATIDVRWSKLGADDLRRAAQDMVAQRPDLIVTQATPTTAALLQVTRTIPIVFVNVSDPVGSGFVQSLARPGGNATGFIDAEGAMGSKWLSLLKEIAPGLSHALLPFNPVTAVKGGSYFADPFKAGASALGVEASAVPVHDSAELEKAIAAHAAKPGGGLVIVPDAFLRNQQRTIVASAAHHRLPAIFPFRYYVERGGLVSYGNDIFDNWRRAAAYIDRILKGEKPSELPVQVPVKFTMVINLKAAKAIGLPISPTMVARADEVIE